MVSDWLHLSEVRTLLGLSIPSQVLMVPFEMSQALMSVTLSRIFMLPSARMILGLLGSLLVMFPVMVVVPLPVMRIMLPLPNEASAMLVGAVVV